MSGSSEAGFEWLDNLHKKRQQCYTTCDWANPAKSSDFGAEGTTASLTDWHELLQITSPDPVCGIVYVRGAFPDNPESILARSQRQDDLGDKGTFGLEIQPQRFDLPQPSSLERGERVAHGLVNFRWPYSQYQLRYKAQNKKHDTGEIGTCEEMSWVDNGTLFQALRLKSTSNAAVRVELGGTIRFGCPCSNIPQMPNEERQDNDKLALYLTSDALQHSLVSFQYEKRLEVQVFLDGEGQEFERAFNQGEHISYSKEILLKSGEPRTVVATFKLVHDRPPIVNLRGDKARYTKAPSEKMESDLGIAFDSIDMPDNLPFNSIRMTDRLWTACVPPNYTATQAREFCALARCVEQIMGVASVPVSTEFGVALINNIMTAQYVDLQSTFWQIRYLVKAHEYISKRDFGEEILKSQTSLDRIRTNYLETIRHRILQVLVWVLKANNTSGQLLLPIAKGHAELQSERRSNCRITRPLVKRDTSYNQAYFQSLTVWYVMKHCKEAITPNFKSNILLPELEKLAKEDNEKRKYSEDRVSTAKSDILQWFRFRCLDLMCREPLQENGNSLWYNGLALETEIGRSMRECEKFVLRLRESRQGPDSTTDEEIDRLYLLGEELFDFRIQTPTPAQPKALTQDQTHGQSTQNQNQRSHSADASSSQSGQDGRSTDATQQSQGAQTVYAAAPSSRPIDLAQARALETQRRVETRKRTSQFNPGPKSGVGSTRFPCHAPWELNCLNHHSTLQVAVWAKDIVDLGKRRDNVFQFILSDYTFMTTWDRADSSMIGRWWDMEPTSVICATLIDLKSQRKLGSVGALPSDTSGISRHSTGVFPSHQDSADPQNPIDGRQETLSPRERILMERIEQLELNLGSQNQHNSHRPFEWMEYKPARLYHSKWQVQSLEVYEPVIRDLSSRKKIVKYFDEIDERRRTPGTPTPTPAPKRIRKSIGSADVRLMSAFHLFLNDDSTFIPQSKTADDPRSKSPIVDLMALDTPLVDLGARHRIIFAERCSPSMVKGVVHLWHPDALDSLDTYFGNISRFLETREALWITNITISHWNLGNISNDDSSILLDGDSKLFKEGDRRKNAEFPPLTVFTGGAKKREKQKGDNRPFVEERCLSLVITGDPFGHSWTCSLWSSITNTRRVEDCIKLALPKLQHFIHQPSSGRCIFFIILLGHICETLAAKYRRILTEVDDIVGLRDDVLLVGLDWKPGDTVEKLKKHLWGLEALRIIGDRLESSLVQIQHARQSVEHTVKQEASHHHIDLVEEYNNVMETFANKYNLLNGVQLRFKSKIIQLTGLRDGISTVTNVEDTQTTIKQGNNIRMLTLITIAYLPLSYVTSLFSVPKWVLPGHEGIRLYLKYLFTFLIATFIIAFSLDLVITKAAKIKSFYSDKGWKKSPPSKEDSSRPEGTRTGLSFV